MSFLNLSPQGRDLLNRRDFLRNTGGTLGSLGLLSLLSQDKLMAAGGGKTPIRPDIDAKNPYAPRKGHYGRRLR